ncbi:MAG: hypothetical protein R3F14_29590 [Polyangiaceae bacterium]
MEGRRAIAGRDRPGEGGRPVDLFEDLGLAGVEVVVVADEALL